MNEKTRTQIVETYRGQITLATISPDRPWRGQKPEVRYEACWSSASGITPEIANEALRLLGFELQGDPVVRGEEVVATLKVYLRPWLGGATAERPPAGPRFRTVYEAAMAGYAFDANGQPRLAR